MGQRCRCNGDDSCGGEIEGASVPSRLEQLGVCAGKYGDGMGRIFGLCFVVRLRGWCADAM